MKIICIENSYHQIKGAYFSSLTIGKVYDTVKPNLQNFYTVIDDHKMKTSFEKELFIPLKEQRKLKLKKISNEPNL